jgi:hypothetical protein
MNIVSSISSLAKLGLLKCYGYSKLAFSVLARNQVDMSIALTFIPMLVPQKRRLGPVVLSRETGKRQHPVRWADNSMQFV